MKRFFGASRPQANKANDDSFFVAADAAFLMDGAGNAGGKAQQCLNVIRSTPRPSWNSLVQLLNSNLMGIGIEATFLGLQVKDGIAAGVCCGDSAVYLYRAGQLTKMSENTKPRLGTPTPATAPFSFAVQKHDVIVVCSDGLTLDRYRLIGIIQRNMLAPADLPSRILDAQADRSDDTTVLTFVV
jgi:Stage II sporulation protein E (SpoIIE)